MVSNGFSARQAMSTLKCHGNFRPEIYFINLRLLNSNVVYGQGGIKLIKKASFKSSVRHSIQTQAKIKQKEKERLMVSKFYV